MRILGISAFYHDSAAALVHDGAIVAAAQEERFTRKKHDAAFPRNALEYCLKKGACTLDQVDYIVFYEKPLVKFERLLETYLSYAPRGFGSFRKAMPIWLKEKLFQKKLLLRELGKALPGADFTDRLLFSEHHLSHAASAFFPSPFEEAAVLTLDGVGEWATTSVGVGRDNNLELTKELHFPHSLGMLYSAFTYQLGFKVNSGEYKVMGLAPYGEPRFKSVILDELIDLKPDGSYRLNMRYFDYCTGSRMTNAKFAKLLGLAPRKPDEKLTQLHFDIAASVQAVTDEAVLRMARSIAAETGMRNLCLAGGVALNCVANGKVARDGCFEKIWIQPAAGDAGGALGAALAGYYLFADKPRSRAGADDDSMSGAFLGPDFEQHDIERRLSAAGARFKVHTDDELLDRSAALLSEGKALAWFQGRMEFGPRALGARSILADARVPNMQSVLNLKVKFRESFRPFAPAILSECTGQWFDLQHPSPYMLLVAPVVRRDIPAATHVDGSARIQTVHENTNARFHALLSRFRAKTGHPLLLNTSFNVRGEPVVCTPEDAFRCFMGTAIEALVVGNCLLVKEDQDSRFMQDYKSKFELD